MERVGILIKKLHNQLAQQATTDKLLLTAQMLVAELQPKTAVFASGKISVIMPGAKHPVINRVVVGSYSPPIAEDINITEVEKEQVLEDNAGAAEAEILIEALINNPSVEVVSETKRTEIVAITEPINASKTEPQEPKETFELILDEEEVVLLEKEVNEILPINAQAEATKVEEIIVLEAINETELDVPKLVPIAEIVPTPTLKPEVVAIAENNQKSDSETAETLKAKTAAQASAFKQSSFFLDSNFTDIPTLPQSPKKEYFELNNVVLDEEDGASLNEVLKENTLEIGTVLKEAPIKDLKKAIGINDRYLFINELFRGDEAMYERSIKTINGFSILPEAEFWINRELKLKLGWNTQSDSAKHFDQLVKRRFS